MLGALLETCQAIPGGCCSVGFCLALVASGVTSASCSLYVMHNALACSIFERCCLALGVFAIVRAAASHAFRIGVSARSNCLHVLIRQAGVSISLANGDHVMSCNGARIALPMLTAAPFAVVTSHQPAELRHAVSRSRYVPVQQQPCAAFSLL